MDAAAALIRKQNKQTQAWQKRLIEPSNAADQTTDQEIRGLAGLAASLGALRALGEANVVAGGAVVAAESQQAPEEAPRAAVAVGASTGGGESDESGYNSPPPSRGDEVAELGVAVRVAGPATPSRGVFTLGRAAPAVDSLALCSGRTGRVTQLPLIAGKGELALGYGSRYSPIPETRVGMRVVSRRQVLLLRALDGALRAVSIGRNPSAVVTNAGDIISLKKGTGVDVAVGHKIVLCAGRLLREQKGTADDDEAFTIVVGGFDNLPAALHEVALLKAELAAERKRVGDLEARVAQAESLADEQAAQRATAASRAHAAEARLAAAAPHLAAAARALCGPNSGDALRLPAPPLAIEDEQAPIQPTADDDDATQEGDPPPPLPEEEGMPPPSPPDETDEQQPPPGLAPPSPEPSVQPRGTKSKRDGTSVGTLMRSPPKRADDDEGIAKSPASKVPLVEYDSDAEDDGDALAQLPRATDPAESEPVEMEAESTTTMEAAGPAPTVTDYTAQADVLLELLSTRYRRTADRARVIEALTASGGAYLAAAHWLDTQGHLRSVS